MSQKMEINDSDKEAGDNLEVAWMGDASRDE